MSAKTEGIAPNASRLLWAGFMAILAAGVGFALRGGIFDNWGGEFGFTGAQLGAIGGAGFSGFCFGIIIGGFVCDKIGYGKLVIVAFALHLLSAFVTFSATTPQNAYGFLFWGMFLFAYANGTLEAVANPLVATLYPNNRTHYLNILHASWPAGMIIGVVLGWYLDDKLEIDWKYQLALYLVPTVLYGLMFMGQKFPKSEASEKGLAFGQMFRDVGIMGSLVVCYLLAQFFQGSLQLASDTSYALAAIFLVALGVISRRMEKPALEGFAAIAVCALIALYCQNSFQLSTGSGLAIGIALVIGLAMLMQWPLGSGLLFVLFVTHALVGAVELGTDGWIQNITGNLFTSEQGKALFLWTSVIMFTLRFCANFIEKTLKISPVGLLLLCSVLAFVGLRLSSGMNSFAMALVALGIYAVGKTFFWPTMLAVASDRYPRTGAVAISIMGGIGMLSAGLIGGPGLGYAKDRFSGENLKEINEAAFATYKAEQPSKFLNMEASAAFGLDGKKLGEVQSTLLSARKLLPKGGPDIENEKLSEKTKKAEAEIKGLGEKAQKIAADEQAIQAELAAMVAKGIQEWDHEYEAVAGRASALKLQTKSIEADRKKLEEQIAANAKQKELLQTLESKLSKAGVLKPEGNPNLGAALAALSPEERAVHKASITGDRKTLKADSYIPATMAVIYLLILLYFKSIGGYKPVHVDEQKA
ncbi:MAG: MFS transporter [Chthoniobacteraceae bacterium]